MDGTQGGATAHRKVAPPENRGGCPKLPIHREFLCPVLPLRCQQKMAVLLGFLRALSIYKAELCVSHESPRVGGFGTGTVAASPLARTFVRYAGSGRSTGPG